MSNSSELKVKYHGNKDKPTRKKNPNVASVSKLGYRDDSPYRSLPYIDIDTPSGRIDMSNTGIPLWANGRILPPYSGIHQFDTTQVKEIPLAQKGKNTTAQRDATNVNVIRPDFNVNPILGLKSDPNVVKYLETQKDKNWREPYNFLMGWYAAPETQRRLAAQKAPTDVMTGPLNQKRFNEILDWYFYKKDQNKKDAEDIWGSDWKTDKYKQELISALNENLERQYENNQDTWGFHIPKDSLVVLTKGNRDDEKEENTWTAIHELTHATGLDDFYKEYFKNNKPKKILDTKTGKYFNENPHEIYPRIQELRYRMRKDGLLAPGIKVTPDMLKDYSNPKSYDLREYYSDEELAKIMNEVAYAPQENNGLPMAQVGGPAVPREEGYYDFNQVPEEHSFYNMGRAKQLYSPDETGHWPSIDYETGEWLKSKQHPTAWMEYLYGYTLNPQQALNYDVRTNPQGYFGENTLQYIPKKQKGGWLGKYQGTKGSSQVNLTQAALKQANSSFQPSSTRTAVPAQAAVKNAAFVKRQDAEKLSDEAFKEKYGIGKHRYMYETDPAYKAAVDKDIRAKEAAGMPMIKKTVEVNPNLMFMAPNATDAEQAQNVIDYNLLVQGAMLPIPGLQAVGKIPGVFDAASGLIAASKESRLLSKVPIELPGSPNTLDNVVKEYISDVPKNISQLKTAGFESDPLYHYGRFLDKRQEVLNAIRTPEGRARIQNYIDNNPHLQSLNKSVDDIIDDFHNTSFVTEEPRWSPRQLQLDEKGVPIYDTNGNPIVVQEAGWEKNPDGTVKMYPVDPDNAFNWYINGAENPSWLSMGMNYSPYDAMHIIEHEFAHVFQRKNEIAGVDDVLSNIVLDENMGVPSLSKKIKDLNPFGKSKDLEYSAAEKIYYPKGKTESGLLKKANYWLHGAGRGQEKAAFAAEIRENLMQRGLLKNRYDRITPELLKKHYNLYHNTKGNKYPLRLYDIMKNQKSNFEFLSKALNRMPVIGGVGLGTGLMYNAVQQQPNSDIKEQKLGGPSKTKAKQMLRDDSAQGHPLTDKQKRYFGWIAGGKKQDGGSSTIDTTRPHAYVESPCGPGYVESTDANGNPICINPDTFNQQNSARIDAQRAAQAATMPADNNPSGNPSVSWDVNRDGPYPKNWYNNGPEDDLTSTFTSDCPECEQNSRRLDRRYRRMMRKNNPQERVRNPIQIPEFTMPRLGIGRFFKNAIQNCRPGERCYTFEDGGPLGQYQGEQSQPGRSAMVDFINQNYNPPEGQRKTGGSKLPPHLPEAYRTGGWLKRYQPGGGAKPIPFADIPTQDKKKIVINNYSKDYDYVVEGDKVYSSPKNANAWTDISNNKKAQYNLLSFINKNNYWGGYGDTEKNVFTAMSAPAAAAVPERPGMTTSSADQAIAAKRKAIEAQNRQEITASVERPRAVVSEQELRTQAKRAALAKQPTQAAQLQEFIDMRNGMALDNEREAYFKAGQQRLDSLATKTLEQREAQLRKEILEQDALDKGVSLLNTGINDAQQIINNAVEGWTDAFQDLSQNIEDLYTVGTRGVKRKLTTYGILEDDDIETTSTKESPVPKNINEYYSTVNKSGSSVDGIFDAPYDRPETKGRQFKQQTLNVDAIKWGVRNRGDYKEFKSDGLEVTAFQPFTRAAHDDNVTVIAVDPSGKMHTGKYKDFKNQKGYVWSPTYMNKVTSIPVGKTGNGVYKKSAKNPRYLQPVVNVIDEKTGKEKQGSFNILVASPEKESYYGSVQGGRVLFVNPKTKQKKLVAGNMEYIRDAFEKFKKDAPYLETYVLDNGTYSRGLAYDDREFNEARLRSYDNENQGGGGNGLYIMGYDEPVDRFPVDYVQTPNVRTEQDSSYILGHPLKNQVKKVILHHTAYENPKTNEEQVKNQYMTPRRPTGKPGVGTQADVATSHVVIEEDGKRTVYASPEQVTFHAGESEWEGKKNVNDFSIGVEFQGNTLKKPLTKAQIESFIEYYAPLAKNYNLSLKDVITHAMIAPGRKPDIVERDYQRILNRLKELGYK